ncbi:hypothetical protein ACH4TP_35275 [Streptomyces sp. NPDC021012]|uniref:hypothetical protein n=1 Tax=Streptomyces sp. NPDC021012 TaxID=3365107 RepID=UPI0037A92E9B
MHVAVQHGTEPEGEIRASTVEFVEADARTFQETFPYAPDTAADAEGVVVTTKPAASTPTDAIFARARIFRTSRIVQPALMVNEGRIIR